MRTAAFSYIIKAARKVINLDWLNRIERKMGRHYIPDLMKYLCLAMLGVFILDYLPLNRSASALLTFDRARIFRGEIWRIITFIFLPPNSGIIWIIFSLYFSYFIGTSLEHQWGSKRFNIYYALGIIGNIIAGFITGYATNGYLNTSLLLSFAVLFPDTEFMLFFFLPVKAKWFGIFAGALLLYEFLFSPFAYKVALLFSLLPFFIFFGKSAWLQLRMDFRRLMFKINNMKK